ncbi:hypothetical protein CsSME_00009612 [Camellia sinensis var. sinensis]
MTSKMISGYVTPMAATATTTQLFNLPLTF